MEIYNELLTNELDKTLAIVGVIFSMILTIWLKLVIDYPLFIMIGILCFISCIGYLIIKRIIYPSSILSLEELKSSTWCYMTLNILFFFLLSYSIITIYLRPDHYVRPLGYFISTSLMAVIVANEILFHSDQKSHIYFTLCKIIIIGLSLVYSQLLIFPSLLGADPWWHQRFTLKILYNGYIPEGSGYSKMPMMHLMIGMTSLVTDLGYKMATMFSISFLQVVCDALFVFLLGKFLISTKVGLLAALFLEVSNYHIRFSYWTIPNTMAATLILPIMFVLFKIRKDNQFIGTLVVMFFMGNLILTHTLTSMFLAILLFIFWLSSMTYIRFFDKEIIHSVTLIICMLFSISMLSYWSYISGHINALSWLLLFLRYQSNELLIVFSYISNINFLEQLFIYLGMFLFFSFSFIGCFYMMSKQFINSNRFITTIGGIMILGIAFFCLIIDKGIIVGRWFYFSQILLAIPLSLSIFLISMVFKHNIIKRSLISILVFVLFFLLIINPVANSDNYLFYPNSGIPCAFTESELHAMDTISEIFNEKVGCDGHSKFYYKYHLNREPIIISDSIYTGDFSNLKNILLIIREETLNHPFDTIRWGIARINYDLYFSLNQQNFSQIYNCGSTSGYLKP